MLEFGENESISAKFTRTTVFYRTATLDINILSRAIIKSQKLLVPKMALHIAAQVEASSLTSILLKEGDRDINLKNK